MLFAPAELFTRHTPYNHFALLAESFVAGRLDLGSAPPAYAANNDFALHAGRHFVVFPPFPALLILPLVALAGGAERVPDGLFFLFLAGIGPAVLWLSLEKLRRIGQSERSERENLALALLFTFGTVYFFTAVQGTVWFAAHVVGVALAAAYLYLALDAEHPLWAGIALCLAFFTRAPLLLAGALFVFEAVRAAAPADALCPLREPLGYARALDPRRLSRSLGWFLAPVVAGLVVALVYNAARFGDPTEPGYRYLTVAWKTRIQTWGLFSYHYLGRNLAVILTSLPWVGDGAAPFRINQHGLALWLTTPLYFLLLWPKRRPKVQAALWAGAIGAALPALFYQNTGWLQFGYRFSNDFSVFLFALLAIGGWPLRRGVLGLALIGVAINAFGAWTFGREECRRFYVADPTQTLLHQPD